MAANLSWAHYGPIWLLAGARSSKPVQSNGQTATREESTHFAQATNKSINRRPQPWRAVAQRAGGVAAACVWPARRPPCHTYDPIVQLADRDLREYSSIAVLLLEWRASGGHLAAGNSWRLLTGKWGKKSIIVCGWISVFREVRNRVQSVISDYT